jgi:pyruvate kinase
LRRTKIICTIGPASRAPALVRRLITTVDVFRINFSHGDRASHLEEISTIRSESRRASRMVAIMQDLPGPKVRVGRITNGSVELTRGEQLMLTSATVDGDSTHIPVNNPDLLSSVKGGDILHLADGVIRLRVEEATGEEARCTVLAGGTLSSGKGVNAPGVNLKVEYPTRADISHLKFGLQQAVDLLAISFVRSAADVRAVRKLLPSEGPLLIAKIEKREAVLNFDEILDEADGVMVARGDLGIEARIETVPVIQKRIIAKCNRVGKPVIVATQMLVSMVNSPVPSRAEVTDVSTAVLDGTDAVMLSDETTVGSYPVDAVRMLHKISVSTEESLKEYLHPPAQEGLEVTGEAIARAACRLAEYVGARAIVAPTQTGSTARRVAKYRPSQPIVAMCTDRRIARQLMLFRGVVPIMSRPARTIDWLFDRADLAVEELGIAKKGEKIVVTSGTPGVDGTTNLIKVSVVGTPA